MAYLFWPRPISLSTTRTGDADLLTQIGEPAGYRNLHVTVVDLDSASPIRRANIGATETTLFETGSLTKALTGLALADSIRRGEVTLDDPVAKHLDFGDAPAGQVTLRELATRHAGYPSLGGRTFWTGLTTMVTAGNPYRADPGRGPGRGTGGQTQGPRPVRFVLQSRCGGDRSGARGRGRADLPRLPPAADPRAAGDDVEPDRRGAAGRRRPHRARPSQRALGDGRGTRRPAGPSAQAQI